MAGLAITIIPCLKDNYAYLLRSEGVCAVIDPPEAAPIVAALQGTCLTHILNTHHHADHSGGNRELKEAYGAQVIGAEKDRSRIPGIDHGVTEKDGWQLGGFKVQVLEVPGHTRAAIAYHIDGALFTGDTLFVMGCGRLFEGTPADMVTSLAKLTALPDATAVYCGHEYTLTNAHFAQTLEPDNAALTARLSDVVAARNAFKPTVPSSIGLEKATNPFLRTGSAQIRSAIGMNGADDVAVFAEIRRRKDNF
jgi:hydroxyacylglutathione hydrolase